MNIPKSYWGHTVLISCFLINRMPSSLLQDSLQSPFYILIHLCFLLPLRFLRVLCLFMSILRDMTNLFLVQPSVSSWVSLLLRRDTVASIRWLDVNKSQLMSRSSSLLPTSLRGVTLLSWILFLSCVSLSFPFPLFTHHRRHYLHYHHLVLLLFILITVVIVLLFSLSLVP